MVCGVPVIGISDVPVMVCGSISDGVWVPVMGICDGVCRVAVMVCGEHL